MSDVRNHQLRDHAVVNKPLRPLEYYELMSNLAYQHKGFVPLPADELDRRLNNLGLRALNIGNVLAQAIDAQAHHDMLMDYLKKDEEELSKLYPRGSKEFQEQWKSSGMMVLMSYCKIDSSRLSTLLIDETITGLFTGQGMFAPFVSETPVRINPPVPKLLAPLYRLVLSDPENFGSWQVNVMHSVSRLVLENGPGLESFLGSLQELEQAGRGPVYRDLLPDIASEVLNGIAYTIPDEVAKAGGVEALARCGVDLLALHDEYQQAIKINSHSPKSFPAIYKVTRQIIEHLAAKEIIDTDLRDYYLQELAMSTVAELRRREERKPDTAFWAETLSEISDDIAIEKLVLGDLVAMVKYADESFKLFEAGIGSYFDRGAIKEKISTSFEERDRYDAIQRLGVAHFYSEADLLRVRGSKFHAQLGL